MPTADIRSRFGQIQGPVAAANQAVALERGAKANTVILKDTARLWDVEVYNRVTFELYGLNAEERAAIGGDENRLLMPSQQAYNALHQPTR